ncbi:MAG TPA: hypothetical protein VIL20_01145 [Sandaracinaceae bacterium]
MIDAWLRAFLLTQAVELGVYASLVGRARPRRERLAIAFGASAITHPLVWFVLPEAVRASGLATGDWHTDWRIAVGLAEAFALTAEAVWLRLFGVRLSRALAASLLANGASFTIGLFLYRSVGW